MYGEWDSKLNIVDTHRRAIFADLYDRYAPGLYGLSLRSLNDETKAQHLLKLVFIEAHERLAEMPPQHKLSWLLGFAHSNGFRLNIPFDNHNV
jgi:DNA-directed RNA polymerase specialized sigma24 family protein